MHDGLSAALELLVTITTRAGNVSALFVIPAQAGILKRFKACFLLIAAGASSFS